MGIFDTLNRHLKNTMRRWPDKLAFNGQQVPCSAVSLLEKEVIVKVDLYGDSYRLTLQVQLSSFTLAPVDGDLIIYHGTEYRVLRTKLSTDRNEVRLDLGDKYSG